MSQFTAIVALVHMCRSCFLCIASSYFALRSASYVALLQCICSSPSLYALNSILYGQNSPLTAGLRFFERKAYGGPGVGFLTDFLVTSQSGSKPNSNANSSILSRSSSAKNV